MIEKQLLDQVLLDDKNATREFLDRVIPLLHIEAARLLSRSRNASLGKSSIQNDVMDLIQHAMAELFSDHKKILKSWDPEKGRSLDAYIRVASRLRMLDYLRSKSNKPLLSDVVEFDLQAPGDVETNVSDRDALTKLSDALRNELSNRDFDLLNRYYVEGLSIENISSSDGLSRNTITVRLNRIRQIILRLSEDLALRTKSSS